MCGINAVGAQGSGYMFTLCHAPLKMGVLLHKMASVCKQALMTVFCFYWMHIYNLNCATKFLQTYHGISGGACAVCYESST